MTCSTGECGVLNESLWLLPNVTVVQSALTATILLVILITAVIFNPLIMVFIVRDTKLSQPSFIFLFCLLLADFLMAVLSIPFYIAAHIKHGWKFGQTDAERQAVCDMVGFFFNSFLSVSIWLLGIVAFDRFLYIVCPLKYRSRMKAWVAWLLVAVVCFVPLLVSALPLFGFSFFQFNLDFGLCLPRWRGQTAYVIVYGLVAITSLVFIFIFTCITCCYMRRHIRGNSRKFSVRSENNCDQKAKQRTLTKLFALLLVTQIVCFLPGVLTVIIGAGFSYYRIPPEIFLIDVLMVLSNAAINPLIQSLVWKRLRNKICFCARMRSCKSEDTDSERASSFTVANKTVDIVQ